jgi:aryl-alcohol dehydrogenase-like predicted oxidoreductase
VEALAPSLEGSLQRLQTGKLDVLLLDSPSPQELDRSAALFAALESLKKEGRIGAYGVSVEDLASLNHALERTPSQVIEVRFNVFSQEAADAFGQARAQGVALVARNPLDSGWLGGHYTAKSTFSGLRARWTPEEIHRRGALVEKLLAKVSLPGTGLAQTALQFVLAHPEVSCVVPGIRNTLQLDYDVSAGSFLISPESLAAARELYFREIKGNPLAA